MQASSAATVAAILTELAAQSVTVGSCRGGMAGSEPNHELLGESIELGMVERIDHDVGVPFRAQGREFGGEADAIGSGAIASAGFGLMMNQRRARLVQRMPAALGQLEA